MDRKFNEMLEKLKLGGGGDSQAQQRQQRKSQTGQQTTSMRKNFH